MLNKILIATGGITGVVATGFGVLYLTSSTPKKELEVKSTENKEQLRPIAQLLIQNRLKMLGEEQGDDVKWKTKWDQLKQDNSGDTIPAPWDFANWTQTKTEGASATPEAFKTECKTHGKKSVKNTEDPIYVAISKYCTKEVVG